ncbi:hypothetical protein F5B22DRAFT_648601 [Xylaria bambusicola]|uniref:uncharacterized protein n=1 Tax=Xylaria bambusicola TaxID=326684 RepID=UPI0020076015|nr:uncharacterized protein F5B22DRAFT_648601 [Xylaria bambusicola]KAI0512495.1 hypothetical protein F5B22DRAFT_648601 [Xylaria bambusicola]
MASRDEKADSESASSDNSLATPTHTIGEDMPDSSRFCTQESFNLCLPSPGKTYFIRHQESGKFLHLKLGVLRVGESDPQSGRYWTCIQAAGWLGFRETGSGKYLGTYSARVAAVDGMCKFVVMPKGNQGCYLQPVEWPMLMYLGFDNDHHPIKQASSDDAALWEFVEPALRSAVEIAFSKTMELMHT